MSLEYTQQTIKWPAGVFLSESECAQLAALGFTLSSYNKSGMLFTRPSRFDAPVPENLLNAGFVEVAA